MKTDDLVTALAADFEASRVRPNRRFALALAAGFVVSAVVLVAAIGLRRDIGAAVASPRFLFKFVVTLTLAAAAAASLTDTLRPTPAAHPWRIAALLAIAPALLALAVALELLSAPSAQWWPRLVGANARWCLVFIPLLAAAPLAALLTFARTGAPASPRAAGAVAGLLSGGLGAALYASHCTDDSPLFVSVWYVIAIGVVGCVGAALGSRWLRW